MLASAIYLMIMNQTHRHTYTCRAWSSYLSYLWGSYWYFTPLHNSIAVLICENSKTCSTASNNCSYWVSIIQVLSECIHCAPAITYYQDHFASRCTCFSWFIPSKLEFLKDLLLRISFSFRVFYAVLSLLCHFCINFLCVLKLLFIFMLLHCECGVYLNLFPSWNKGEIK